MSDSDQEQLRVLKQIEAIGRLSSPVAHDINNLLSGILGYSELLLSESNIDHLKPYIEEISKASKRIASLTRVLLIFSRKYIGHPEEVDLNSVLLEIEKIVPYVLGPNIRFAVQKGSDLWPLKTDPVKIKQAVITLAIDMRELMPDGGSFLIETANFIAASADTRSGLQPSRRYVLLAASGTGKVAGDQVFSCLPKSRSAPENSSKEPHGEISNVYEIIRSFGGDVFVESRAGEEVKIKIFLPALAADQAAPQKGVSS